MVQYCCVLLCIVGTDTVAVQQGDGSYKLYGYKWFTSATDADMTFTLARVQDEQGLVSPVRDKAPFLHKHYSQYYSVFLKNSFSVEHFISLNTCCIPQQHK